MRVLVIRHGQSTNNAAWDLQGSAAGRLADSPLTELGRRQAHALGRFLALDADPTVRPAELFTSLMTRAIETAEILAGHLGMLAEGWEDLHETGGIFLDDPQTGEPHGLAGPGRTELLDRFSLLRLPESVRADGWWNRAFESEEQRLARAERVAAALWAKSEAAGQSDGNATGTMGVVTHGAFYSLLMYRLLGLSSAGHRGARVWFSLNNAATTLLELSEGEVKLLHHNGTAHLGAGEIS